MRTTLCICAALLSGQLLEAQVTLNPIPSRVIGQNSVILKSAAPNLVEGREFTSPQSVTLDTTATPPILYVSDTGNNRVLAWQDATKAGAGAYADLVIGQRDKVSTGALGPGTSLRSGLRAPTGLTVDGQGNLYVVDSGNNRILRFPRPFDYAGDLQIPDLVIGQKSLDTNAPNIGGVSASTIATNLGGSTSPSRASLAFDAAGNLYFTDALNNRVLRYPASALGPGAGNAPAADLVLGQANMTTGDPLQRIPESVRNKAGLNGPGGLALDQRANRLLVTDSVMPDARSVVGRVLVYPFPLQSGMSGSRIIGVATTVNETLLYIPEGIIMLGSNPAVVDSGNNRILIFDPIDQWPEEAKTFSPQAKWVLGQSDMSTRKADAGAKGLRGPVQGFFFNNELYVADSGNHRVMVFPQQPASPPASGGAVRVVGQLNFDGNSANLIEGKELFLSSSAGAQAGMAIDQKSDPPRLYIADTFNNRILGYRDARRIKNGATADLVIGQPDLYRALVNYDPYSSTGVPTDAGGLFLPTGLAVDANGNLFVADFGNGRVLRFPKPFDQSGPQRPNLVLGQSGFFSKLTDASARTMAAPYGVALTPEGHLAVSDAGHHRVLLFTRPSGGDFSNGQGATAHFGQPDFISTIQGTGAPLPPNRMNSPRGIAVDSSARLYVCDAGNNRILIYDAASSKGPADDPNPAPPGLTGLRAPYWIEVSLATGEIWVTDTGNTSNSRVVRYRSFEQLPVDNYQPNAAVRANVPLAAALDGFGNLFVAEAANRVAIYYPAVVAVNAANYVASSTRALSPGVIATLYPQTKGGTLAPEEKWPTELPWLPKTLGDVQLLFNDSPAPLYYVGPGQVNFVVPMSAPISGTADLVLQRASTGQVLAAGLMQMGEASPALLTAGSGSGQVAALNQDNTVNSPTNAAARGEVIQLWGTGQGFVSGAPPDGEPATGLVPTSEKPLVWIEGSTDDRGGYVPPDYIQYSGLTGWAGVWQINVKIPDKTAPGSRIIFVSLKSIASSPPQTRISVK